MAHKTFHCWIVVHCWRKTKRSEMETKECVLDCAFWRCIGVLVCLAEREKEEWKD